MRRVTAETESGFFMLRKGRVGFSALGNQVGIQVDIVVAAKLAAELLAELRQ